VKLLLPSQPIAAFLWLLAGLCLSSQLFAAAPAFVGNSSCKGCHDSEYQLWKGSHHDWAMQPASDNTVLGDFNDVSFEHYGEMTRLHRDGDRFLVTTNNAQGEPQTFEVAYTFGFYPLQQYLLPVGDGRLQALSVSWDSRPKAEGGQRWFHLFPHEAIPFDDPLHWTGSYFTWNSRCAECHSTNLERNYNAASNSYETRWSEINVSCEACHGPASEHLKLAQNGQLAENSTGFSRTLEPVGNWLYQQGLPTAINPQATQLQQQLQQQHPQLSVCGSCHARRSLMADQDEDGEFHQKHNLQLLQAPLYHADGQILDEVYVLGSFLQSKMHQQGVVCSNCHEPHSLELRAPGNGVCAQCHSPQRFDTPDHHHHPVGSDGASCANCHMPETTYMVVDPRRDHSLRIPRPDLSVRYGTPNACTQCHNDKPAEWAADAVGHWLKDTKGSDKSTSAWHFSDDLVPALSGSADAQSRLMKLAMSNSIPALVQASAVDALSGYLDQRSLLVAQTQLNHSDAMVRTAAIGLLAALPPEQRWQELKPLLSDSSKQVRLELARQLLDIDTAILSENDKRQHQLLLQEYWQVLQMHLDTPNGQMNLGLYQMATGHPEKARAAYEQALAFNDSHLGAYLNLADWYRQQKDETAAEQTLVAGLKRLPEVAALHHSLGLLQVRQQNYPAARESLGKAAQLEPENAHYGYLYGLILQRLQQPTEALVQWQQALKYQPNHRNLLLSLLNLTQTQGQWTLARDYAQRLAELEPDNPQWRQVLQHMPPSR
jgi:tetratricopeptide (TPR) repeat protein